MLTRCGNLARCLLLHFFSVQKAAFSFSPPSFIVKTATFTKIKIFCVFYLKTCKASIKLRYKSSGRVSIRSLLYFDIA
ncbi:hypothetical protein RIR_jg33631.t1 [Rhizophagus irregularis DAOM 181602=DAOM 197198]|nr:hypothetical protein RIR_jg33631.t1 [Rhizophagus irregularis DAOM 181602=DAOM 197198]